MDMFIASGKTDNILQQFFNVWLEELRDCESSTDVENEKHANIVKVEQCVKSIFPVYVNCKT